MGTNLALCRQGVIHSARPTRPTTQWLIICITCYTSLPFLNVYSPNTIIPINLSCGVVMVIPLHEPVIFVSRFINLRCLGLGLYNNTAVYIYICTHVIRPFIVGLSLSLSLYIIYIYIIRQIDRYIPHQGHFRTPVKP